MMNIDLLRRERDTKPTPEAPLTQEIIERDFSLVVPENIQDLLDVRIPEAQRQELVNCLFPEERRQRMMTHASKDVHERTVVYYRHMRMEHFVSLLKHGSQDSYGLLESKYQEFEEYGIRATLTNLFLEGCSDEMRKQQEHELSELPFEQFMYKLFPSATREEISETLKNKSLEKLRKFLDKYLMNAVKQYLHKDDFFLRYSPYMALSVGGPIDVIDWGAVHIEVVLPDEDVIIKPMEPLPMEKEVIVRTLSVANISRVFFPDQLRREIIDNPDSIIGYYNKMNPEGPGDPYANWLFTARLPDLLPVGILKKYRYFKQFNYTV